MATTHAECATRNRMPGEAVVPVTGPPAPFPAFAMGEEWTDGDVFDDLS